MPAPTITLGDLITDGELKDLIAHMKRFRQKTPHKLIMVWLKETDEGARVADKMSKEGIFIDYGAYMLEYFLQIR